MRCTDRDQDSRLKGIFLSDERGRGCRGIEERSINDSKFLFSNSILTGPNTGYFTIIYFTSLDMISIIFFRRLFSCAVKKKIGILVGAPHAVLYTVSRTGRSAERMDITVRSRSTEEFSNFGG